MSFLTRSALVISIAQWKAPERKQQWVVCVFWVLLLKADSVQNLKTECTLEINYSGYDC